MSPAVEAYQEFGTIEETPQAQHAAAASTIPALDGMCEDLDVFCENHIALASEAARQRKEQMQRRLAFIQTWWNDPERFEQVVITGRYLKLCNLTEWISDYDEQAWERIKTEVLAAREQMLAAEGAE